MKTFYFTARVVQEVKGHVVAKDVKAAKRKIMAKDYEEDSFVMDDVDEIYDISE